MTRFVKALLILVSIGLVAVILTTFILTSSSNQNTKDGLDVQSQVFKRHSLVGLTPREVSQVAISYIRTACTVLSGDPQVLLAESVTADQLPDLGLGSIGFANTDIPLVLVILKGDFDMTHCMHHSGDPGVQTKAQYVAYVFDLIAGIPTFTSFSLKAEDFRQALNETNLPRNNATTSAGNAVNTTISDSGITKLPYGAVLPTVIITPLPTMVSSDTTTPIPSSVTLNKSSPANATQPKGIKGITPHLTSNAATLNTPAFNEADVKVYLAQAHPEWGFIKANSPITITNVQFLPNKQIDTVLKTKSAASMSTMADNDLVCLVTGDADFSVTNAKFTQAYWVFDIHTGNLLTMGGYGN
jgi:hypothetical protein